MSDQQWTIYTLSDPRTPDTVRYVGVTHSTPTRRLSQHIRGARTNARVHSARWIKSLLDVGLTPVQQVVDHGVGIGWEEAETHWISWHRGQGHDLTNHATGGRGPVGCTRSPETRAKLAAANLGKKQSPELIEKRVAPLRGRTFSPEVRQRLSEAARGRKLTPEGLEAVRNARQANPDWRAHIAETNRRTWERKKLAGLVPEGKGRTHPTPKTDKRHSEATKAKMRSSRLGKVQTVETREKRRLTMQRIWAERRASKALSSGGTP